VNSVAAQVASAPDLLAAASTAAAAVFSPVGLAVVVGGALLGMAMGAVPGLGGPVALSLLIPLTFDAEPTLAFMLMAATLGGVNFGGSVTAILLNTPGTAPNAATTFDGYPLAVAGRASEAIAASAVSSGTGALVGLALFALSLPVLTPVALAFWAPEYFWLAVVGIATIAVASRGSVVADVVAGGVGVLLTFHGVSAATGGVRFTLGTQYLEGGVPLIPAIVGLFALAQMAQVFASGESVAGAATLAGDRAAGVRAALSRWRLVLTSSLLGWTVGVVPGVGGTVANYVAYLQARETDPDGESFGTGNVAGVVASEAANDAKDGGSLVPTLALGIPGSASTAVLLGAFLLHGLVPGPLLLVSNADVVFVVLFAFVVSNVVTSAAGLVAAAPLERVTRVDADLLVPVVLATSVVGAYAVRGRFEDVVLACGFGLLGYAMLRLDVSRVALVIGLVLGSVAEQNFHRSLQISGGEYGIFLTRPLSLLLVAALVAVLALPVLRARNRSRDGDASSPGGE
jgi:putative tricarboxylic transport membrane protein